MGLLHPGYCPCLLEKDIPWLVGLCWGSQNTILCLHEAITALSGQAQKNNKMNKKHRREPSRNRGGKELLILCEGQGMPTKIPHLDNDL